jgi:hypothetical protein
LDAQEVAEEMKEDGFEEVPIFGAGGEEGAEPEGGVFGLVDVKGARLPWPEAATSKPKRSAECGMAAARSIREKAGEVFAEELVDLIFTGGFVGGAELAEALDDLVGLEMDAFDLVVEATPFDGGPFDNAGGGGAEGIAHVGLLVNFFGAGTGLAIGDELFVAARCVNGFEEVWRRH